MQGATQVSDTQITKSKAFLIPFYKSSTEFTTKADSDVLQIIII